MYGRPVNLKKENVRAWSYSDWPSILTMAFVNTAINSDTIKCGKFLNRQSDSGRTVLL